MHSIRLGDKIPAFKGKAMRSNIAIFLTLALNGPKNRYELQKITGLDYGVIHRRISALMKEGYLIIVSRKTLAKNPNQSAPIYHLSLKGLIASLAFENDVSKDFVNVLRRSPAIKFPSKEESLTFIETKIDKEIIEKVCKDFFQRLVQVLPYDIEVLSIRELNFYILPTIKKMNLLNIARAHLDDDDVFQFIRTTEWMTFLEGLYKLMDNNIKTQIQARDELRAEINKIKSSN